MIGTVSVFSGPDHNVWLLPWLRSTIELCKLESWSEVLDVMNSFIWIGLVFDKPGKHIFDTAMWSCTERPFSLQ